MYYNVNNITITQPTPLVLTLSTRHYTCNNMEMMVCSSQFFLGVTSMIFYGQIAYIISCVLIDNYDIVVTDVNGCIN